nr:hypothetical protein [Solirubrobacterales bacterium]
ALAWLRAQPTVASPIASARNAAQLAEILPMAALELSGPELERLDQASSPPSRRESSTPAQASRR